MPPLYTLQQVTLTVSGSPNNNKDIWSGDAYEIHQQQVQNSLKTTSPAEKSLVS